MLGALAASEDPQPVHWASCCGARSPGTARQPPRFIKEPKDQIGVSGGVASFVCQAAGDPKPRVTWNKKGKKVNSQRFETIEFDESAGAVLRIQPLRTPRDENVYECVAQNPVGEIAVHAKLTVLREDQLPPGFPNIDMGPQLKVVERTRTATMLCAASGNPDPEITWFKDFLPVDPSTSSGRIKQLRSESTPIRGALQIESSEETDQGKYECVATNSAGVRYSSPANLYVRVRRVAPRFSILPMSHEIMPGGNVNITCVAVGSPMPYVKWMQGAEDLTPEDDMPVGRNVLELTDVKDSANYTCVAMSSLGVIEAVAQITVKSLPKAPGTPVVTENTATSITITWDSGNPDPVSYYVIEYKSKSQDGPYQIKEDITTTRYSIGGLSPNSEYEIWVSAVNSIGQGPPSESVVTRTGEQAPASAPRNVQARMLSATTMIVQWEEPVEPNGLVRGYRVYYTMEPEHPVGNWQKHNVDDSLLTTVGSLLEDETYTVRVLAFTSVGDGPLSDPIQVKTQQGVPGQPMNFRAEAKSETSIGLSWSPPRQESIIKYELLFREADLGREVGRTFDPATAFVVDDLKPNTEYAFRLAARSPQGLGAFTSVVRQRTLQSSSRAGLASATVASAAVASAAVASAAVALLPSSVSHAEATRPGSGRSLSVRTQGSRVSPGRCRLGPGHLSQRNQGPRRPAPPPPAPPLFPLPLLSRASAPQLGAWVLVREVELSEGVLWLGRPRDSGTGAVQALVVGVAGQEVGKKAQVRGPGDSAAVLLFQRGGEPLLLARLMPQGRGQPLAWDAAYWRPPPPETHNGALVSYSVRYRPLGSEDPQAKEVNGIPPTTTQILLEALDKWTEYRITAVAHTEVGPGPESSPVVIRTDEDVPSAPPRKVEAEALNATAIRVLWRSPAPGRQHGQIRGYQVHYVRMEGAEARGPPRIKDIMLADAQEMVITNLQPETAYSITVAAYTMKGDGARSKPKVVVTTGAVLGRPTLSVQQTPEGSLLARWEPPAGTAEDQVLGYRLQFGREDSSPLATLEFPPTEDHYTALGVHRGATYVFRLAARGRGGLGEEAAEALSIPEDTPRGHPQILEAAGNASAGTVLLRWLPPVPAERNGAIVKYTVAVREAGALGPARETELPAAAEPGAENVLTLQGLKPDTAYDLQVRAHTRRGPGPYSPPVRYRTLLQDQVSPKNFKVRMVMKTSVLLSWEFPDNYNSPTPYKIQYNGLTLDVDGRTTKKLITRLKPNTFYNFVLTSRGSSLGGLQQTVTAWTAFNLLSAKPSVAPKPDSDGFIMVYLPDGQSPVPVQYAPTPQAPHARVAGRGTLGHLTPGLSFRLGSRNYFIVMVPLRKSRGGQFLTPLGSPEDMDLEELTQDVSRLQRRSLRHSRQLEVPRPYITARFSVLPPAFHPGDQKQYGGFDNRGLEPGHRYVLFVLAALQKSEPTFAASPFSDPFQLDNPDPQPIVDGEEGLIWVIGPVLAVVFIICIVIAILLYKNKRKDSEPRTKCLLNNADLVPQHPKDPVEMRRINFQTPGMLSHPPIPIADMAEHTERLKANDSLKLSQEYESIDPGQQFTWEHSNLEVNKPKNRYANVIAYDHSRVILQPIEGIVGSDYINANYVDGYRRQNAYIATQGPLPETFGDFWRMVWEQRSATIVMMTRLEEKSRVKCDQYWPGRGTETYGFIQVTLLDTIELATFCVRTFSLHKNGSSEKREVRQFQFTAWPDHGVPEYPTPFLAFLRRVKTCNPPDAGPIVVHCSAGVGRTGCFIVIDAMLERIKPEKTVDVYGHVTLMRSQRNYMVQTEDQYSFIHEALLEAVGCGNTEVPARSLYAYIQKLAQVEPGEHVTGMELEFKAPSWFPSLQRLANSKAHTSRFISANLPCNKFKNRLVNIMPYESTRVCLQPIRGVEGSDYINASFIDGYRQQRAYIATQGPLAETTEDFWRMLWENNSTIVVMLTKLREMGREKCHQYWPAERSARYQYFVVDPMAEYNMPQYILREFKVTDARVRVRLAQAFASERRGSGEGLNGQTKMRRKRVSFDQQGLEKISGSDWTDGQSRTVRQFQFTDWPEQGVPKSGEGFIDFIGQVHKTKEQFGQDGPISVHCSAGVGRTGVFITLSIVLERMRYEGVVDIFQTVKMLRTQRPAMVQTEDEYQFCYQAALEYLGSFDHYAT
ncbi:Receptor-type tyrosine-protein phosphatase S [Galemys pyrenaicus]|uniref:Receptor-type tyrosine-protein phosphatase S n=1 Tax=Galemys pyrenaicus TaxID=202257 RepID=A0A8J6ACH9_GALPY|nr:Receptor-type tyrosine-protein phosphatase S [Galemys pyrenaicus]